MMFEPNFTITKNGTHIPIDIANMCIITYDNISKKHSITMLPESSTYREMITNNNSDTENNSETNSDNDSN